MQIFIFLSEILGKKAVSKDGSFLGKLRDLTVSPNDEICPKVRGLVLERGLIRKEVALVNINDVLEFNQEIVLNLREEAVHYQSEKMKLGFSLCQDILDRQVVDIDNRKVVRVNDIHLLRLDSQLFVAHMDVGLRGLVRRLGWTKGIDYIVRSLFPASPYLKREDFIPWKNAQVLTTDRRRNILRLDIARNKLSQIPAMELAEIMEDLDIFEQLSLLRSLDEELRRRVFADLATQEKHDLIEQMDDKEAVGYLENIPADEATDLLLSLPKGRTHQLMKRMESKTVKKLRKLLGFAKDSAGGLMTTEYLSLKPDAKVKDAVALIKENLQYSGNIYHIYIVDEEHRLLGSTSIRYFLNEDPEKAILETCYPTKIFVHLEDGMEEIALLLEKYKFSSIPVLNEEDILQGVITTDDVMEELIAIAWKKYKEKLT